MSPYPIVTFWPYWRDHSRFAVASSWLGVRHIDLPLAPQRVWRAINATRESTQG